MNKEQTQAAIEVMNAYVRGEKIQYRWKEANHDAWNLYHEGGGDGPVWDWNQNEYRIAPRAPREFCLESHVNTDLPGYARVTLPGGQVIDGLSAHEIKPGDPVCRGHLRVREVID